MSGAVQLAASRRLRTARAALDAQRLTDAVLRTQGADGKKGEKGEKGDAPDHEWQGTKLRFEKPSGGWGEYVELRGPKGARGTNGAPGGGGGDMGGAVERFDLSALPLASSAPPVEFVVRQGDAWVRASFAQMLAWFPGGLLPAPEHGYGLLTEAGECLLTEAGECLILESGAAPATGACLLTELGGVLLTEAGEYITQEWQ